MAAASVHVRPAAHGFFFLRCGVRLLDAISISSIQNTLKIKVSIKNQAGALLKASEAPTPIFLSCGVLCNVGVYVSNCDRKQRARKPPLKGVWGVNPKP